MRTETRSQLLSRGFDLLNATVLGIFALLTVYPFLEILQISLSHPATGRAGVSLRRGRVGEDRQLRHLRLHPGVEQDAPRLRPQHLLHRHGNLRRARPQHAGSLSAVETPPALQGAGRRLHRADDVLLGRTDSHLPAGAQPGTGQHRVGDRAADRVLRLAHDHDAHLLPADPERDGGVGADRRRQRPGGAGADLPAPVLGAVRHHDRLLSSS